MYLRYKKSKTKPKYCVIFLLFPKLVSVLKYILSIYCSNTQWNQSTNPEPLNEENEADTGGVVKRKHSAPRLQFHFPSCGKFSLTPCFWTTSVSEGLLFFLFFIFLFLDPLVSPPPERKASKSSSAGAQINKSV